MRQIISEPELGIQPFDENQLGPPLRPHGRARGGQTFQSLRAWNLALFRLLGAEELSKTAIHPERGPEKASTADPNYGRAHTQSSCTT